MHLVCLLSSARCLLRDFALSSTLCTRCRRRSSYAPLPAWCESSAFRTQGASDPGACCGRLVRTWASSPRLLFLLPPTSPAAPIVDLRTQHRVLSPPFHRTYLPLLTPSQPESAFRRSTCPDFLQVQSTRTDANEQLQGCVVSISGSGGCIWKLGSWEGGAGAEEVERRGRTQRNVADRVSSQSELGTRSELRGV